MNMKVENKTNTDPAQKQMKILIWVTICSVVLIGLIYIMNGREATPKVISFDYEVLPVRGDPQAPVKIVELGDFKCPGCKQLNNEIMNQVKSQFIDKGVASLYFMNRTFIGPDSVTAALAAQAVFHQSNEAYWIYLDSVYEHQGNEREEWATPDFLIQLAKEKQLPIDYDLLQQDIAAKTYQNEVDAQNDLADANGINKTPTLFINGKEYTGRLSYEDLSAAIQEAEKGAVGQ